MKLYDYLTDDEKNVITESINDKGILKSCFICGGPGSGKSYVLSTIKSGQVPIRIVNTDIFTEYFGKGTNADWKEFGEKIKLLSRKKLTLFLNSMLPLFIDGTSASPSSVYRRKGILESIGYDTSMVWIETSLETSLKRNQQRKRHVPEEFIKEVYEKGQLLKPHYKSQFKPFLEINNDEGELSDDIILKAYKKVTGFFNTEVKNPIGTMLIEDMIKNGQKYLEETETYDINYINKLIDSWYKR